MGGASALLVFNSKREGDHVTVVWTNLKFPMEIQYDNMDEVFRILRDLQASGTGNVIHAEVQLHITGGNAITVPPLLKELEDQRVLSNYKLNECLNQIESFRKLYLK